MRSAKLFTADAKLMVTISGMLSADSFAAVQEAVVKAVQGKLIY